ncbi:MAG TPA: carbamate kinase [Geminicoccaceae bacterium]|nr:carbamate kinase [Geminicoccaceae bacterium]
MTSENRTAVVAVGGNSLIVDHEHESIPAQSAAAAATAHHIAGMVEAGWNVVVTHGSGPQVGFILRRSEIAIGEVPPVPMDYAAADLQGAIGYMFQRALRNEFRRRGLDRTAIAVVTQVVVDRTDPAFADPIKPIGSIMDEPTAKRRADELGWIVKEDPGRGWRRVVPSPRPKAIVEIAEIEHLLKAGYVVIACGGGGIPVFEDAEGDLVGVEAVIDKDLASSLLARTLDVDLFLISTGVEKVALNFGQPDERWLDRLTRAEAEAWLAEGHFGEGSMAPKIRALVAYLEHPGRRGLITDPPNIGAALAGRAGTSVVLD